MEEQTKKQSVKTQEPDNSHIGWEYPQGFLPEIEEEDSSTKQEPR